MSFLHRTPLLPQLDKGGSKAENISWKNIPAKTSTPRGANGNGDVHRTKWELMVESSATEPRSLLLVLKRYQSKHKRF